MTGRMRVVIGGVDTHADTHEAAVLDGRGRLLAVKKFVTTDQGIQELLTWMRGFGRVQQVGVEGTGSYGAELTRQLRTARIKVIEVNQPHAHTRSRRGKTDAIDAEAAARKVLAGECTAIAKDTTGIVEAVRQLHVARAGAVQARTAALNQLDDLACERTGRTAPEADRQDSAGQGQPMCTMAA
jgi:transposase